MNKESLLHTNLQADESAWDLENSDEPVIKPEEFHTDCWTKISKLPKKSKFESMLMKWDIFLQSTSLRISAPEGWKENLNSLFENILSTPLSTVSIPEDMKTLAADNKAKLPDCFADYLARITHF